MKYFLSNDKCQPLRADALSEFLEKLTFRVNSVGTWKRDYKKLANYTVNDVEFIFYVSGESKTTILGNEHRCQTDDFMILEPMQLYTSENKDQVETEYYFIHFDVMPSYLLKPFLQCFQSAVTHIQYPERILKLFQIILYEVKNHEPGYISKVNASIKLMTVEVIRSQDRACLPQKSFATIPSPTELFVDQCIAYINNNLKGDCSVKMLCEQFSVSPNYVYKAFMEVLNQSPSKYIAQLRIFRAKSLLVSDLFTIEQVAEEVGYTSLSHFSKVFKEQMHCSPSQFRKQHKP